MKNNCRVLLVIYDNDSYIHWFPQGLAYIATALRDSGREVIVYNQDQYHFPDAHLTRYLTENKFDVVCVSVVGGYYQYHKLLKISDAINRVPNRPYYIIGGHGPSPEPEYFLKKTGADVVVIGEGEITSVKLLDALENKASLSGVNGIAYMGGNRCVITPRQELISNIDTIHFPAWDIFPMDYYALVREANIKNNQRAFPVLSGRGCTFRCNFCYRMDKGFRPRSSENIIEEIEILKKDYAISHIIFSDELLMSSAERTIDLCEAFIKSKLNVTWTCNGRLNYAKPEVLNVMKRSGCVFINYGIESVDDQALKNMGKALNYRQIVQGIEATIKEEISPGLNIIFGNIGENKSVLKRDVEFLLKYDDHSQLRTIRPVTPYPGSPLYYYAIEKGLLKDCADFYENKHVNSDLLSVNFTDMTDDEFHLALFEANKILLENYYNNALKIELSTLKIASCPFPNFHT